MVIYNLIKFSDRRRFSFSILVQRRGEQDSVFRELGCEIFTIPYSGTKDNKEYYHCLVSFFDNNHFTAVHTHMHNEMGLVLKAARACNVRHRIAHSHNARVDLPRIVWPLRFFKHHQFEKYATDLFGCSEMALRWLFPVRWRKGIVIHNAIDLDSFSFNETQRNQLRGELGISDSMKVIINVGRCTIQKNQGFILGRAKELIDKDVLFFIIGDGPLFKDLEAQVERESIKNVIMLGERHDVSNWLNASDIFMLPSLYEGLGIVAIEAQATGLPVIAVDTIPEEANLGVGIFRRISLARTDDWARCILELDPVSNRSLISQKAMDSHYNIITVAKEVSDIYTK